MRRVVLIVAAVMFFLGTANTAQAQIITLAAVMTGANETPPVLNGSYGIATVTVNLGTLTVTWSIDVFNLPSGMNAGHFHVGGPGVNGPTVVNLTFPAGISNDFNLSGSATTPTAGLRPDQGIRSWEDFIQAVVGGQTYLNIHTAVNGGGEIRGQVLRTQQPQQPPRIQ